MSNEVPQKMKAVLIIAMLAGAKVQQVRRNFRFGIDSILKSGDTLNDCEPRAANPSLSLEEYVKLVDRMESLLTDLQSCENRAMAFVEQIPTTATNLTVQKHTKHASEQVLAIIHDIFFKKHTTRVLLAEPESKDQAKRVGMQLRTANSGSLECDLMLAKLFEVMLVYPKLQQLARVCFMRIEDAMAEPTVQKTANLFVEQAEVLNKLGAGRVEGRRLKERNGRIYDVEEVRFRKVQRLSSGIMRGGLLAVLGGVMYNVAGGSEFTIGNLVLYMPSNLKYWNGVSSDSGLPDSLQVLPLTMVANAIGIFLAPMVEEQFGPKSTSIVGAFLMGAGVFISSYMTSLLSFVVFYAVVFGFGVGLGYQVSLITGGRWFPNRRGIVSGFIVAGFGGSASFFNLLDAKFVNPYSLNAVGGSFPVEVYLRWPSLIRLLGIIYCVLGIGGALLQSNPSGTYAKRTLPSTSASRVFHSYSDVLTIRFFVMWIMIVNSAASGLSIASSFKTFGTLRSNLNSDAFLTFVGSLSSLLGNAGGRLFWGSLMDILGFRSCMIALTLIQAVLMFNFRVLAAYRLTFAIATISIHFCLGGNFAMFPAETFRSFETNGASVYGVMFSAFALSSVLVPTLSNALIKQGGYELTFSLFGSLSLVATFLSLLNPSFGSPHNSINDFRAMVNGTRSLMSIFRMARA